MSYAGSSSWLEPAQTSANQLGLVQCGWQIDSIRNSVVLLCHFCFGLQQERVCKKDLSGIKLSVNIANPWSKLLCTEVREEFRKRLFMFRTWIVRQRNPVWVGKFTDSVTSLGSELVIWTKSHLNMLHVFGIIN